MTFLFSVKARPRFLFSAFGETPPCPGNFVLQVFPLLETFVLPEKALSESPHPRSNQGSPGLIYGSSN